MAPEAKTNHDQDTAGGLVSTTDVLAGFAPLIGRYDGFLLDQWGVLHDGETVYPGVLNTLRALAAAGKRVVLLSNSGKRAAANAERLTALGIDTALYRAVVTSGELAWRGLRERTAAFAELGERCLLISRGGDRSTIDGLAISETDAEHADFVLLAGTDSNAQASAEIEAALAVALARRLPLVCCNPDFSSVEPGSEKGRAPGAFALDYQRAGGRVRFVGKPWPEVYRAALTELDLPADRVLAVGDSLDHDIKGAAGAGIDAALTRGGVHRDALAGDFGAAEQRRRLAEMLKPEALPAPRWLLPDFQLGKHTQ